MVNLFVNSMSIMLFSMCHFMKMYSCLNHFDLLILIILHMFARFIRLSMVSNKLLMLGIKNLASFLYSLDFRSPNLTLHCSSHPSTTSSSTYLCEKAYCHSHDSILKFMSSLSHSFLIKDLESLHYFLGVEAVVIRYMYVYIYIYIYRYQFNLFTYK